MIHYSIQGQGNPLVLIHGFPNDSTAWNPILPELTKRFRVFLPDLPGAGKSMSLNRPLTMELMALEIKAMLDKEGVEKAVLAGHSMGGYTTMECANIFPERIQGISLIHSLASADNDEKKELRRKSIALMQKGEAEKRMFLKGMAQNLFDGGFAEQHSEALEAVVSNGMRLSTAQLSDFYTAIMFRTDRTALLEKLDFPVQWIIGNHDNATPMKDAMEQCHQAKTNSVSIYKPCGHMSFVEMPQRLTSDLIAFMELCY
ncbi:alpha/beta hydrolase [Taibaiella lutea]|uniref:Alpha/beta hydrolase n=1 Tax=Taibaiella lutea TaxID=2608001 RepID=A0A5M6CPV0_9BACT|nr:alpha/beta hydrolase [Taibaiella lutea]KAA5537291.1 alpha/beta hydrolase [Taibaiella lutea]